MALTNTYFKKTGKIYGVSSKYDFGTWYHEVVVFDNIDEANEWLNSEEYDSRERELTSQTAAIKLAGKEAVDNAMEGWEWKFHRSGQIDRA